MKKTSEVINEIRESFSEKAIADINARGGIRYKDFVHPMYPDQLWNTREDGTLDVSTVIKGNSLTQQQFKNECDINNIMKSYVETGTINHLNRKEHLYGDFSEVRNFQESLDLVRYAQAEFMQLPAKVRSRFNNDPTELVEFCNNPNNLKEAIELGLAQAQPPQQNVNQNQKQNTNTAVNSSATNPSDAVSPSKSKSKSEE